MRRCSDGKPPKRAKKRKKGRKKTEIDLKKAGKGCILIDFYPALSHAHCGKRIMRGRPEDAVEPLVKTKEKPLW